jgi:2-alkenal reductase
MAYEDSFGWQPRPLPPPPPARRPSSSLVPLLVTVGVVALLVGGFLLVRSWWQGREAARVFVEPEPITPRGSLMELEETNIKIYRNARPSVVHITTLAVRAGPYRMNVQQVPEGTGSGFVWDEHGHVVTNYHVVRNADAAQVTLADQTTWKASLVGGAPDKDLAVLRINAPRDKLRPIPVGKSEDLQVGQMTFAIGNPFGLDQTLTTGVISALQRRLPTGEGRELADVIQTDAPINPGNSGGPLLDSAGRVIGVNTAIFSPSGASAGIGFAIPIDVVNRVVPELIRTGRMPNPGIGIIAGAEAAAARLGIEGVVVLRTLRGSPAAQAGIRGIDPATGEIGDIIVAVEGKPVRRLSDLTAALERAGVGKPVRLTIERDGRSATVSVTVADVGRAPL